ncbi:uncharacterized protein LOC143474595 [Brachyhypopomus gauderio]|uniref:uncharacterized protein LOC143474595 n=1 Tax=Brachyhypopomus gauderio TaxID=698409 RepID=UPI004041E2CE
MQPCLVPGLLFAVHWVTGAVVGQGSSSGMNRPVECCLKTSDKKIRVSEIARYVHQYSPLYPIKAVQFYHWSGDVICSDPMSQWARKVMREVDRRTTTTTVPEDSRKPTTTEPERRTPTTTVPERRKPTTEPEPHLTKSLLDCTALPDPQAMTQRPSSTIPTLTEQHKHSGGTKMVKTQKENGGTSETTTEAPGEKNKTAAEQFCVLSVVTERGGLGVSGPVGSETSPLLRPLISSVVATVYSVQQGKMKQLFYLYKCLFVFVLQWMSGVSAGMDRPASCCLKTTNKKIRVSEIAKYVKQEVQPCPIKAVRFYTWSGDVICSDPMSQWARKVMREVDRRKPTTTVPETTPTSTQQPTTPPGPITLPGSTETWITLGLTTTNWRTFVTSPSIPVTRKNTEGFGMTTDRPSTTDRSTTYTKYPTITSKEATSIATKTLRTTRRTSPSPQDPSTLTSVVSEPSDITNVKPTSLTTKETPGKTTELLPRTLTKGAVKRTSTMDTSVRTSTMDTSVRTSTMDTSVRTSTMDTSVRTSTMDTRVRTSMVSQKVEPHRTAVSSHTTAPSLKTKEPLPTSGPPAQETFTTIKLRSTRITTTPRKPMKKPTQTSKVTRLPWLHRRRIKKRKMGLRRVQKRGH